jgi:hypothetical protein
LIADEVKVTVLIDNHQNLRMIPHIRHAFAQSFPFASDLLEVDMGMIVKPGRDCLFRSRSAS